MYCTVLDDRAWIYFWCARYDAALARGNLARVVVCAARISSSTHSMPIHLLGMFIMPLRGVVIAFGELLEGSGRARPL